MSLMTIPWTLSKRLWARARARGEPSYFIVFSKNARCSSVRGCTYLTIGTSSWGVQLKAKVYIVLDMGRYYTKKLLGGRLFDMRDGRLERLAECHHAPLDLGADGGVVVSLFDL